MTSTGREVALRKSGDFSRAAPLFKSLWEAGGDPWDGWGLGHCLRKLHRYAESLPVLEAVIDKNPSHDLARGDAAWCIYYLHIKDIDRADSRALEALQRIKELLEPTSDGPYGSFSALPRSTLQVGKLFNDQKDHARALLVTDSLDPLRLSDKEGGQADGRTLPSDRENWHLIRTKALDQSEQWKESLEATSAALASGIRFHLGQATWIQYRRARALHHLGDYTAAEDELKHSGGLGKIPVIDAALGAVLAHQGKVEAAIAQYARALVNQPNLGMAVKWLSELADLLRRAGRQTDAASHDALQAAVREKRGWPIKSGTVPPNEGEAQILGRLKPAWQEWSEVDQSTMSGTVTKLIQGGIAGFIRGADGQDYYFSSKEIVSNEPVVVGARVEFIASERFDRKKDRMSPAAIRIRRTDP